MKKTNKTKNNTFALDKLTLHKLDWLEWITIGLAVWFFFYPKPYEILLGVLLVTHLTQNYDKIIYF